MEFDGIVLGLNYVDRNPNPATGLVSITILTTIGSTFTITRAANLGLPALGASIHFTLTVV